jgi:hypothetical protein
MDTRDNQKTTGTTADPVISKVSAQAGSGYSANAEYRLGDTKEYRMFARYDSWTPQRKPLGQTSKKEDRGYILGGAWVQNSNVEWVGNVIVTDNEKGSAKYANNGTAYMLTARVSF